MPLNLRQPAKHTPLRVFKYRRMQYMVGRILTTKETWTRMIRASCQCGDCLCTGPDADGKEMDAATVDIRCDEAMDGRIYRAVFVEDARDHETGHIESWHWRMVPIDTPAAAGKPEA